MTGTPGFALEIHEAHRAIAVRWTGLFCAQTVQMYLDVLSVTPYFHACDWMFHDAREMDFDVSSNEILRAARLPFVPHGGADGLRIVLLVGSDLAYGMSRMFASVRGNAERRFGVFRDITAASAWAGIDLSRLPEGSAAQPETGACLPQSRSLY